MAAKATRKAWKAPQRWVPSAGVTLYSVNYKASTTKHKRIVSLDTGASILSVRKGELNAEGGVATASRDDIQKDYPLRLIDRLKRKDGAGLVLYM
jgi:hypothetical protein